MDDKALPERWLKSCQSLNQQFAEYICKGLERKNSVETKPIKLRLIEKNNPNNSTILYKIF